MTVYFYAGGSALGMGACFHKELFSLGKRKMCNDR